MSDKTQAIRLSEPVQVNLFDQKVSGLGKVIGHGVNTEGETVYLVEMESPPEEPGHTIGTVQIQEGKPWVLSCYPEEVQAAMS